MSLVKKLRDEIVDTNVPASAVLRKAKILAATLNDDGLKQWLNSELNGYAGGTLPAYRQLTTPLLGTFRGPRAKVSNQQIPISKLPEILQDKAEALQLGHSIREIEAMSASPTEVQQTIWPAEAVMLARECVRLSDGLQLVELHQPVTKPALESIVDSVRTRFLDFLLGLQDINPEVLESESAVSEIPGEQVSNVFNVSVYGDHNVVAPQSTIGDISVQTIQSGDRESLTTYLKGVGLTDSDIEELEAAIKEDGKPAKDQNLGKSVSGWIGNMVGSAARGTWKIALGAAPVVLKDAISHYYGWE